MQWVAVIDVSQHQGTISFPVMRARGVRYVILRISHGQTKDARVAEYYQGVIAAGFQPWEIAFYSFINPKRGSAFLTAAATAAFIREITGRTDVTYMLDIESYRNETPNVGTSPVYGSAFAQYVRDHIATFKAQMPGCRVFAYSNRAYWNSSEGPNSSALAADLEWLVPRYPLYSTLAYQTKGYPPTPERWDEYAFTLATGPFAPIGATRWCGWQFSAGFNAQGSTYGCQSSDLDLDIVDAEVAARWFPSPVVPPNPSEPPVPITPKEPDVTVPHDGSRLLETRPSEGGAGPLKANAETAIAVAPGTPSDATGVFVNITFLGSLTAGYLALWSGSIDKPKVSQLNWNASAVPESGFTLVKIVDGFFAIEATSEINLIIDQVGYTMPAVEGAKGDKGDPGSPGIQGVPGVPGEPGEPGPGVNPEQIVAVIRDKLTD